MTRWGVPAFVCSITMFYFKRLLVKHWEEIGKSFWNAGFNDFCVARRKIKFQTSGIWNFMKKIEPYIYTKFIFIEIRTLSKMVFHLNTKCVNLKSFRCSTHLLKSNCFKVGFQSTWNWPKNALKISTQLRASIAIHLLIERWNLEVFTNWFCEVQCARDY